MKPTSVLLLITALHAGFIATSSGAEFDEGVISPAAVTTGNTLEDFFTAALNASPELSIARERWNIGSARKNQTNGQLLPQVNATANISDNERTARDGDSAYTGERYSVQVNQVLFNWQAFAARQQAYLLEDASEAEYYAQLAQLLTIVADRYLSVLQAEDELISINSEMDAMTNQINQIQDMFDLQLVKITDLYAAQARQAAIAAERVEIESGLAIGREALRAETGLDVGNLTRLPALTTVEPLSGSLDEWLGRTTENNKQIEARTYALEAAKKQVSQRRGAYLPRVSLVLQHQESNVGFDNARLPNDVNETDYIGIDFSIPLFAGGTNRAVVREAVSMRNIAAHELRKTEVEIAENARTAYFQVKAGESRIEAARLLSESTSTYFAAMQRGFELGGVTSVDVLNSLRDQFQAERDLQRARYDHIRANLVLRREAGILTANDLLDVSRLLNQPAETQTP
ncbi:MAG: TolC family protein [Pseudomonadota bacterium]